MSYAQMIGLGNSSMTLLRAKPMTRALPNLGSGIKMFDPQPSAVGNSKLQFHARGENIKITA